MKPLALRLWPILVIIGLGWIIYADSFQNAFHLDDYPGIVHNSAIRHPGDIQGLLNCLSTRFTTYYSLALNYQFGQLNVAGYHWVNWLIHVGASLLAGELILLMLESGQTPWIAFFGSLIFLAHPLQTQAVNYIIQRASLWAAFFYMAGLVFYARARIAQRQKLRRWIFFYCASFLSAVLCMFSKENAITLPLMICVYEFCFVKKERSFNWKITLPFLALTALIPWMLAPKQWNFFSSITQTVHDFSGGVGPWPYFLTQLRVKLTYLRLLVLPIHQNVEYDYALSKSIFEAPVIFSGLALGALFVFAFWLYRRFKLLSFGIFWFFITLLPESSFWPNRDIIFEHRLYLPMLGFALFVAGGIMEVLGPQRRRLSMILLSCLVLVYGVLTYNRNKVWHDEMSLWNDAILRAPGKEIAYLNRGAAFQNMGKVQEAAADYIQALKIDGRDAIVHSNLGLILYDQDRLDQALDQFNQAVQYNGGYAGAFFNRGRVFDKRGDLKQAAADYSKAIAIKPDYADAYKNRGMDFERQGMPAEALADYNKALQFDPHSTAAIFDRAQLFEKQGRWPQALEDYNQIVALNPQIASGYNNRGVIYSIIGRYDQAFLDYNEALKIDPEFKPAQDNLKRLAQMRVLGVK